MFKSIDEITKRPAINPEISCTRATVDRRIARYGIEVICNVIPSTPYARTARPNRKHIKIPVIDLINARGLKTWQPDAL